LRRILLTLRILKILNELVHLSLRNTGRELPILKVCVHHILRNSRRELAVLKVLSYLIRGRSNDCRGLPIRLVRSLTGGS
jgi:hypothetical protein